MTTLTANKTFALKYVKTIGINNNGFNGRGFTNPNDLAFSKDGRIFVMNRCDYARISAVRVGICNFEEEYLEEFGSGGSGDGQFVFPTAMAFDSHDRLYITDESSHRISIFDSSGNFVSKWGEFGCSDGEINGPAGIAIDSEDTIYISDQHNHRIQKFTTDGQFLSKWGEYGSKEGQLNLPWGLTTDIVGNVYVADWRNHRVQKFSPNGRVISSFGEFGSGDGQFRNPSSVAVDSEGYIYVADWGNERVQVLGSDGSFQVALRGEATVSLWAREFLDSNLDEDRERVKANLTPELPPENTDPYYISSQTEPYFWGPISVKLDTEDRLYVTETNRHRFQIYQKKQ